MLFAHDTEVALARRPRLVNTEDDGGLDTLGRAGRVRRRTGAGPARAGTPGPSWTAVQALRPRLRAVWAADEDDAVEIVNGLLREFDALPQLVRHDEWAYHLHATAPEQPLADRMAVEAAMAFVDVIRTGELDRLRICAADDCDYVVVDLSKNRSRRFCDAGCGNRANVAAYRARQARTRATT